MSAGQEGHPQHPPDRRDELRALRRLQREQGPKSPIVFMSERGAPFTTAGFSVSSSGPVSNSELASFFCVDSIV
jgi:hypothetical protein